MNVLKLFEKEQTRMPSVINDPFGKSKVTKVFVYAMKMSYSGEWRFTGSVEFTNGSTKGEQEFVGDSFDDVVLKIKAMIETLEK